MSVPSRCLATATKGLQIGPVAQAARRTFASRTANSIASLRTAPGGNTTCLREAQRLRNGGLKNASNMQGQTRTFSQSALRYKLKTIDQIKARNKGGVRAIVPVESRILAQVTSEILRMVTNINCSLSTSRLPSSSSQLAVDYSPISSTRRSAWHGSG